jgi:hypothetical protein
MKNFPTKQSLPGVLWHDNNCNIVKMLRNDTDEYLRNYFENCALPVDVFHFKSKHKEGDLDCGANCNPYIWEELRTADGKWRFNSSAAEQTNAWFGGFQSIVREMSVERYNFFLDEMIKRRNRILVKDWTQADEGLSSFFVNVENSSSLHGFPVWIDIDVKPRGISDADVLHESRIGGKLHLRVC